MTDHSVPDEPAPAEPEAAAGAAIGATTAGEPLGSLLPLETPASLERILEALLLAADQPLPAEAIARLIGEDLGVGRKEIRDAFAVLEQRLAGGASELVEVSSGFRIQVRAEYSDWVARLWQEKPQKFSRAMLETLALVCYRQPITRGEIEDIRGVGVSQNIMRTLLERGWIREIGVKEVPGRPALFATTPQFLDDFNLTSLEQLPTLPEIKDLNQLDAALAQLTGELPGAKDATEEGEESADGEQPPIAREVSATPADEPESAECSDAGGNEPFQADALPPGEHEPEAGEPDADAADVDADHDADHDDRKPD